MVRTNPSPDSCQHDNSIMDVCVVKDMEIPHLKPLTTILAEGFVLYFSKSGGKLNSELVIAIGLIH